MDHGIELAPFQPIGEAGRRNDVGELALLQVAPLAVRSERIVDDDVSAPRLVEIGDDIRSDKSRSAGNQQHEALVLKLSDLILRRPHSSRGRLEGWPRARSRLWLSFETPASFDKLRSALGTRLMDGTDVIRTLETPY